MKLSLSRRLVAMALASAMVLAACGDDDDTVADDTTTTEATPVSEAVDGGDAEEPAPEPTGEPVKIGTTLWTNEIAAMTSRIPGIEAAVDRVNAEGGIQGRPLEWVYCPAVDANEGEQCARTMVEEGVVATIGDGTLVAEGPHSQILADAGIPQINPFVNSPEALNSENVFMFHNGTPIEYATVVTYMKEKGLSRTHFLSAQMSAAANSENSVTTAADHYGIEIDGKTEIPITATDYTPYLAAADEVDADVNMAIIGPFMTELVLQGARDLGMQAKLGISEGQLSKAMISNFAAELEGSLIVGVVPPFSAADQYPAVAEAVEDMDAYYEETGDEQAAPEKRRTLALREYLMVRAFAEVAEELDEITAEAVKQAYQTSEGIDVGLDHPWVPSNPGPEGYSRVSNPWMYLMEIKGGEAVLAQDEPVDALEPFQA
jgi:branched-chain amino acid transport system substrate-binding protein